MIYWYPYFRKPPYGFHEYRIVFICAHFCQISQTVNEKNWYRQSLVAANFVFLGIAKHKLLKTNKVPTIDRSSLAAISLAKSPKIKVFSTQQTLLYGVASKIMKRVRCSFSDDAHHLEFP
jgi:hypothetical protein